MTSALCHWRAFEGFRKTVEEDGAGAGLCEIHIHDTDLRGLGRTDAATKGFGKQLVTEAEPEERKSLSFYGFFDERLFVGQPGMGVLLPDIHRPAHDPERVIAIEAGQLLALVKFDGIVSMAVFAQKPPENPWMFDAGVLQYEYVHGLLLGST